MIYKAGQRARIGRGADECWIGREVTFVHYGHLPGDRHFPRDDCVVDVGGGDHWNCCSADLVPLTPPAIDTWAAEQVRKVTKVEPQPVPVGDELPTVREVLRYYQSISSNSRG